MHLIKIVLFLAITSPLLSGQEKQTADPGPNVASITGSVLQADTGAAVKNVHITIVGPSPEARAAKSDEEEPQGARQSGATTDENGNFTFESLKPGAYHLLASHAGMVLKGAGDWGGMAVQLQSGHAHKITLLMLAAGAITGRVLNEHGEPMQNVSVAAMRNRYSLRGRRLMPVQHTTSNDKGEYRLFGLKPGPYLVFADGMQGGEDGGLETAAESGYSKGTVRIYAPTYYPNETSPEKAMFIVVKPGDEAQANFSLVRVTAYKISGKVLGLTPERQGKDAEERFRYVTLTRGGSMYPVGETGIGKDSSFEFTAVPSGKYTLVALDSDRKGAARYGFREVAVESSDVTGITISLNSTKGQLSGFIRTDGESKLDLSELYVVFVPAEPNSITESQAGVSEAYGSGSGFGEVKSDGSFKAELPPASGLMYSMVAARGGGFEDWYTSKVLLNGKDVLDSGFKTSEAQRSRIEIVISAKGGTVEGIALNSENKPFPNAQIIAVPADPKMRDRFDLMQKATADQQGKFRLRGVRPGEYTVIALEDAEEQPFAEDSFLKQNAGKIRIIRVEASTQQVRLETINIEEK